MNNREFAIFLGAATILASLTGIRSLEPSTYVQGSEDSLHQENCRSITMEYGAFRGKFGIAVCERMRLEFIRNYFPEEP